MLAAIFSYLMSRGRFMKKLLLFCTCLFICVPESKCFGQTTLPDSGLVAAAIKKATALYTQTIDSESHLYHGLEYVNYDLPYLDVHQFYRTDDETEGTILYDGARYTQVPLLYDLVLDQVIIEYPESAYRISLITEKIKEFSFLGHNFIRLEPDTVSGSLLVPGFYDLLVTGNTSLLVRRTKNIQERAGHNGMEGEFHTKDKYYIQQHSRYYQVHSKKSVLQLFPDQKKELQKYARSNKLNFRKKREAAIMKLIQYYNSLPVAAS